MPALKNYKHENFCQSYIKGESPMRVMREAGYKWNSSYFTQLKNNYKIAGRILELQRSCVNENILNLEQRQIILSEIAVDEASSKTVKIRAIHELHNQSGDNVNRIDIEGSIETNNIIRFIEVTLPKVAKDGHLDELEGINIELDEFAENNGESNGLEDIFDEDGHSKEESPSSSHSLEDLEKLDK